ncbi:putative reverse transcriptase domain-containing protein [Tanacetum coccineum]
MEVDIEEDENEPKLIYPYEEVDPLNPPPLAFESEPEDVVEIKDTVEPEDETVPASIHEVGESDINSLFGRMTSLSRRLCGCETTYALVEKKGKAKDEYYGKLILDLGNEVRSSVEEGTYAMENLVRKLGNAEEKAECKKLKKELKEARRFMFEERPNEAINVPVEDEKSPSSEPQGSPRTVELRRWFEKTESVFGISECAEGKKVKFDAATLEGPALTWWNSKVATMGLETVNQMPWTEMKQLMTTKFCPIEESQRMEHELWNLRVKEYNIGEVTSSRPTNLNEAVRMAYKLMEQKLQARDERIMEGKKRKWEKFQSGNNSGNARAITTVPTERNVSSGSLPLCERCFTRHVIHGTGCPKEVKQEETGGDSSCGAYAIKDVEPQGYDKSFMDTTFTSMLDIDPDKIDTRYEVELADGRIVSTNTVLKCCTLNLVNHLFQIDLNAD